MNFIMLIVGLIGAIGILVLVVALWTYSDMRKKQNSDDLRKPATKDADHNG